MTCNNCIHYELCEPNSISYGFKLYNSKAEIKCKHFKDKNAIQEVTHGKWEEEGSEGIPWYFRHYPEIEIISRRCSNCERISYELYSYGSVIKDNYCPLCGAKMDKE